MFSLPLSVFVNKLNLSSGNVTVKNILVLYLSMPSLMLLSVLVRAHGKSHEREANCLFTNFFKVYYYIHSLYSFIARDGALVYPMRIKRHICVVDKLRNIHYIKWKSWTY